MAIRVRRQRNECISGLHKSKRMARPADNFPGFTVNRGKMLANHDNAILQEWSRNQNLGGHDLASREAQCWVSPANAMLFCSNTSECDKLGLPSNCEAYRYF
jgi:hypothetical protein